MNCPLCQHQNNKPVKNVFSRQLFLCNHCKLVFLDPGQFLCYEKERDRYLLHQNNIDDQGYINFLNRLVEPLTPLLNKEDIGLDYGCGPSPTLSILLEKKGFTCNNFDPIFFNNELRRNYDFICATECFEHFFYPANELKKISNLLRKDGLLGIMTEFWNNEEQLKSWYYMKDPTHVCFYNIETFNYIADTFGFRINYTDKKRVVILQLNG